MSILDPSPDRRIGGDNPSAPNRADDAGNHTGDAKNYTSDAEIAVRAYPSGGGA